MRRHKTYTESSPNGNARLRSALLSFLIIAIISGPLASSALSSNTPLHKAPTMSLFGDGIEFSSEIVDGVQAKIHISDVRADMKKLNSAKTHLMAIRFFDSTTNEPIPQGHAAIYLTSDHDKTGFFDPMKNQDGIFVAGLLLVKPGVQHVIIASKLRDRKTRDFHVHFTID